MKPTASHQSAVPTALVLAAGNGDRFRHPSKQSKLLEPILGRPIILRTIDTAAEAGIQSFEIVLGYQADRIRDFIERFAPTTMRVRFVFNPAWHLENGESALAAADRLDGSGCVGEDELPADVAASETERRDGPETSVSHRELFAGSEVIQRGDEPGIIERGHRPQGRN